MRSRLAAVLIIVAALVAGIGVSPASARTLTLTRAVGSCSISTTTSTLGGGYTRVRANTNACLHIRAHRSANWAWLKKSNPSSGGTIYLTQGNNTWVEFEGKSEYHVTVSGRRVDTVRIRCNIIPGDWYSAAAFTCTVTLLDT